MIPAWRDRPRIGAIVAEHWRAFLELHERRSWNVVHGAAGELVQDPQPIPLAELVAWCELNSVRSPDDRREFSDVVAAADRLWLTWWRSGKDLQAVSEG